MVMKFIEKIRQITKEAKNIERTCPYIAKVIEGAAAKGNHSCYAQLTPEEIEALRAEGFKVSEASFLFEHYIEWQVFNMITSWEDMLNNELKYQNFSANGCNEITHEAIAKRERPFIIDIILEAANKGCFSTTLPIISQDTRNWLASLNFQIYSNSNELKISWSDEMIKK